MKASRREWLGKLLHLFAISGSVAAVAGLLHWGKGHRHTAQPRVDEKTEYSFRPPGALPEEEFLSRCIHCYLCQDVCPPGCIQMKPDDEFDRQTPYIIPRLKACTLCLKCGEVCPTGALRPLQEPRDVRMGVAVVDETICVSHLRTGACGACFTACPIRGEAITQGLFNAPFVHAEHCTGCGLCEEVCIVPYRAIRVRPLEEALTGEEVS